MALFSVKKSSKDEAKAKRAGTSASPKLPAAGQDTSSMKNLYQEGRPKQAAEAKSGAGRPGSQAFRVLLKPMVTEKASVLGSLNKYVFEVATKTNKIEVAKAIRQVYGVSPVNVRIISMKGKAVVSKRIKGRRKDWKKAIVTLPKGSHINVYEGV